MQTLSQEADSFEPTLRFRQGLDSIERSQRNEQSCRVAPQPGGCRETLHWRVGSSGGDDAGEGNVPALSSKENLKKQEINRKQLAYILAY